MSVFNISKSKRVEDIRKKIDSLSKLEKARLNLLVSEDSGKLQDLTLTELYLLVNQYNLIYCEDWKEYLLFNGKYYYYVSDEYIENDIFHVALANFEDKILKKKKINTFSTAFQNLQYLLPEERKIISNNLALNLIALKDCVLDCDTSKTSPHSPEQFCFKYIDENYTDFFKECPVFLTYLQTTFIDSITGMTDPLLIDLVQEMFGAVIFGHEKINTAFFFVGVGANGKSTLINLIQSFFDQRYVSHSSLKTLTTNQFGTADLIGKILNVCSEEQSKYVQDDLFKSIVSKETIRYEKKNKKSSSFKPMAAMIFATNDIPKFPQLDLAMKRRIMIVPFHKTFKEKEQDKNIDKKLAQEKAPIIAWALDGYLRLKDNDFIFSKSEQSLASLLALESDSSSAIQYINEHYSLAIIENEEIAELAGFQWMTARDIFDGISLEGGMNYETWCGKYNNNAKMGFNSFSKSLKNSELVNEKNTKLKDKKSYYYLQVK